MQSWASDFLNATLLFSDKFKAIHYSNLFTLTMALILPNHNLIHFCFLKEMSAWKTALKPAETQAALKPACWLQVYLSEEQGVNSYCDWARGLQSYTVGGRKLPPAGIQRCRLQSLKIK